MKIAFHGRNASNFRPGFEALLDAPHEIVDLGDALGRPGDEEHFVSADVIIGVGLTASHPVPARLKLWHAPSAGTDTIDRSRLPEGAALCCCFGHENAIAEYVMTALLLRHVPIPDADARLRRGEWTYYGGTPRGELGSQAIGLLGFGHIGKAIAARARAFGMRVVVANRTGVPTSQLAHDPEKWVPVFGKDHAQNKIVDESYGLDRLRDFMGRADAIVASLPLTDDTRGIVGAAELAAMRPGAVIVNVGRGPVIDQQALYDALAQKRIDAVIDTWYDYPSKDNPRTQPGRLPFNQLTNLVMTPHMSGWTAGMIRRRQQTMADNIRRLARGEALNNVVA
jgi:phosphoglycerate dehydrogenase-like enzyme